MKVKSVHTLIIFSAVRAINVVTVFRAETAGLWRYPLPWRFDLVLALFLVMVVGLSGPQAIAQIAPGDHQAHHPDAPTESQPGPTPSDSQSTGMMEDMGEMMRQMGVPPPKELYPTLMTLPDLSPEQREEVELAAHKRMESGTELMAEGLDRLAGTLSTDDYEAMQRAVVLLREGLARFDSGLAAKRAVTEAPSPKAVALAWLRKEMSLSRPTTLAPETGIFGVTWFHFWIMLSSTVFAVALLWLYFLKMRRASLLLRDLTTASGSTGKQLADPDLKSAFKGIERAPDNVSISGRKWTGQLRIGRIFQETADVKTFRLLNPVGGILPFDYLPGQFITVTVPHDDQSVRRSYTIASSPAQRNYIEITVKHAPDGVVSGYLHSEAREGGLLEFSGPAGAFVFTGRECKCILLIAGGVGITPLMSVLRCLLDRAWNGDIFLLYACRSPADIIFREELDYLQRRHANLQVVFTVSQTEGFEWRGAQGRITKELVTQAVPDLPSRYVHVCGPVPMMEATKQLLSELGVPAERIKTEAFGPALGKEERSQKVNQGAKGVDAGSAELTILPTVTFVDSNKAGSLPPDKVVLDVAEDLGVDIDYSCRAGICGVCRVELISGDVSMAIEDGLQPGDKENHIILACQARASGDISVKA
jgi:ferredoxin-NADP reductase|tara:strand:- start:2158 stop:4101 length:1944 start_codon:yes stop_codon:yes gene_type:complete